MKSGLYHVEEVQEIIETILLTSRVSLENPVSLLLVGPSGIGKTRMLACYKSEHLHHTDSVTSMGLYKIALNDQAGKTYFLLIPDINPTLSRKPSTVMATLANLLTFTSDGSVRIDDGREAKECKHRPVGMISAATIDMYEKNARKWYILGLRRRIIPIFFSYTTETTRKLQDLTSRDKIHSAPPEQKETTFPEEQRPKIPYAWKVKIESLAVTLAHDLGKLHYFIQNKKKWINKDVVPISPQITLMTLARAHAIKNGRKCVNGDDYSFLCRFVDFCDPEHPKEI